MSPVYSLTERNGTVHHVDLRRIVAVEKSAEAYCSTFRMDCSDRDLILDDDVSDPLTAAWRAYHGPAIYRILPMPSCEDMFVDLRRIVHTETNPSTGWTTFYTDPDDHSFSLHPVSAGPLLAAWLAFHAPREPAPAKAPELPEGWEARLVDGNVLASGPDGSVIIYEAGDLRAWGPVPLAVVEAVTFKEAP